MDIDNCSDISVNTYVSRSNKKLAAGDVISANSCVDVVIDVKYVGKYSLDREVSISRVALELGVIKG